MSGSLFDPEKLGFDPDALRRRYREERDKRLRPDANEQYVEVAGEFSDFVDDPYVDEPDERAPLTDDSDVIVIGGGFGGLLMAARLRMAGVEDIRIVEKAGDLGGTWYWNRYPGAACDVESYIYLPLLEEVGTIPKEKYSRAEEIFDHARNLGKHFDLYRNAVFQTTVTEVVWDEDAARWVVHTNRNDRMRTRFLYMANGPLHRPKLPGIPGIDTFRGHTFHTSRWDYSYTGGDARGNLTGLGDKSVGIVGTGATAVQVVPHVGASAKQTYVFQRTPSSIFERHNRPTDPEWVRALEPGWQQARMDNFNLLVSGQSAEEDLVADHWTDTLRMAAQVIEETGVDSSALSPDQLSELFELGDMMKMQGVRDRVGKLVSDPKTAEALKPYYRLWCKRPCFDADYLDTFNRPNVELVDTHGKGVDRITDNAVIVDGVEYPVDCLIFATGFEVGTDYTRRSQYDAVGRNGLRLSEKWAEGFLTFQGFHTHGFPNLFTIHSAQGGFTPNYPHFLDQQARHLAHIVSHCLLNGIDTIEATQQAEDAWVEECLEKAQPALDFSRDCTPGYYNNEGNVGTRKALLSSAYGGGAIAYWKILEAWRESGEFTGLTMTQHAERPEAETDSEEGSCGGEHIDQ